MGNIITKIALVHEWFDTFAGSEKVVRSFVNIWKDADVYALVDFLDAKDSKLILDNKKVRTSFIQNLPFSKNHFRNYLPLFPLAVEQFDFSDYDVVLSSSHAVAKGALTNSNQLHFCYCHTPMRYAWDLYHQYLKESKLESGIKGWLTKYILHRLRIWDAATANRVDYFIANSKYIAGRINKVYRRTADVIYPPVDIDRFELTYEKDDYYLTASRFVPYKKIDLIVEAFSKMPDKKLIVIGDGPQSEKIRKSATSNIEIVGHQTGDSFKTYMQKAKAFLFAAEEDFGITMVEAQACGTPVIAYGTGGAAEIVLDGKTGILFGEQNHTSIIEAVNTFEKNKNNFNPEIMRQNSERFSRERFEKEIRNFVETKYIEFKSRL